jgi:hypothetical protein
VLALIADPRAAVTAPSPSTVTAHAATVEQPAPAKWGFPFGEGTLSATPLAWPHAQFIRLARGIAHGSPVETPSVVACRHVRACG